MSAEKGPIEYNAQQSSLDRVRNGIVGIFERVGDDQIFDTKVFDIDIDDIHQYLKKIQDDQDLEYKLLRVQSAKVQNANEFRQLCDYTGVSNVKYNSEVIHRVYYLESSEDAICLIPIQLLRNQEESVVNVNIQSLEYARKESEVVKKMYGRVGKMSMEDIPFVKL